MTNAPEPQNTFTAAQTNPMAWDEFHGIVNTLIARLAAYQKAEGFAFDAVAPLLRSVAIPAVMIANKLQIVPMVPLQTKYDYSQMEVATKLLPSVPAGIDATAPLNVLAVECNTYTGQSARQAYRLLRQTFPRARLHYACVTKVFGGPEKIADYDSQHIGRHTNEAFKSTDGIGPDGAPLRHGITIFPWETVEYELADINAGAAADGA